MNPWTERILKRAVGHLEKEGKSIDQALATLLSKTKETIDPTALKDKIVEEKSAKLKA